MPRSNTQRKSPPLIATTAKQSDSGATLASAAYGRLRQDIINSVLPPGSKLRVQELCQNYGMGQSPLREALNRLTRDGLVKLNDRRGFSVTPLSYQHLDALTKTRCWINEIALRESIVNGDRVWEEGVVLAYYRLSRIPRHDSGAPRKGAYNSEWEQAHRAFHTSLISACDSPWLITLCEQLFDEADRYRHLARISEAPIPTRRDDHKLLVDAVTTRDADQATTIMKRHLSRTGQRARGQLLE